MKNTKYIKAVFLCLLAMTVLSSCLKDKRYVDFKDVGATIDFPAVAFSGPLQGISIAPSASLVAYPVLVNVSVPNALSTPVNVGIKVDPAALTAYNTANKTAYTLMPSTAFSIANLTVTVPANQTSGTLTVNFNTAVIAQGSNYVLPLTIASTDQGTITQYKTILYQVTIK